MFLSRVLKISVSHLKFQNGKSLSDFTQYKQVRRKLIYPMNKGQIRVLMDIFGVRYRKAYGISRQHTNLRTIDQTLLYKSAAMLTRFGITKDVLLEYPQMLSILPMTIENHAMLLQEAGFTSIKPNHLLSFIMMIRKPVKLFKVYNYIPQDVIIHNNFFADLEDPPPPLELLNSDDSDFVNVYSAALAHYLCWKLEMSKHDLERLLNIYPRLRYRSFRLIESSVNILEKELGFTKDKIRRHGYLIHSHSQNILDTMERIKYLGGLDIRRVFRRCPKIVMIATDSLLKTDQYLQDFGIPNEAIQRCFDIYTLSSETVNERLHALQSVPEFVGLITNPRVVRLVHYQRKACSRLRYLEKFKFKCVSLHLLQSSQAVFEKYLNEGSNRTRGNDVVIYLSHELEHDHIKIRKSLHRHPFWYNVPLVTVLETLNFLRNKGFTKEQILFNIQILLYSSKQVKQQLEEVPYHPDLSKELLRQKELHNGNEIEFSREQQLALCLYLIERDHHFSGDGIWFENPYIATSDDVTA